METAGLWEELPHWARKALLVWGESGSREQALFPENFIVAEKKESGDWQISYREDGRLKILMLRPRKKKVRITTEDESPRVTLLPLLAVGDR